MNNFGYNLQYLRKAYSLTQSQLGNIIGKSTAAISRYEMGLRNPKEEDINKLCTYFGLEPADLMYRKLDEQTKSIFNATELELMAICKLLTNDQLKALLEVAKTMIK